MISGCFWMVFWRIPFNSMVQSRLGWIGSWINDRAVEPRGVLKMVDPHVTMDPGCFTKSWSDLDDGCYPP